MDKPATKEFRDHRTGESCVRIDHPSGLPIFVCPKPGYQSTYAVFAVKYGSVDTAFVENGREVEVPAGIAHYLEHKLFENEDCGAFERYAITGASANAYTSFERTAYLFICTGRVEESLEILLDFVQRPYFTEETVRKEQGIIGQEIRMCEDSPNRRVLFNLLKALYQRCPVRVDIAGTVESIAEITPELLYGCYRSFYNLRNMVLVVAGNVDPEAVLRVADRVLVDAPEWDLRRTDIKEPVEAAQSHVEAVMPVAAPLFYYGYKCPVRGSDYRPAAELAAADVLLELIVGKSSPLYARLLEKGLINDSFGGQYFEGPGYAAWLFGGESRDPNAVAAAIREEIDCLKRQRISDEDFKMARNMVYGRLVAALNDVENCGDFLVSDYFYGRKPFELIDTAAALDIQSVYTLLDNSFLPEAAALSVVRPAP